PLVSGSTYFISVRAQSGAGTGPVGTSIPVLVDFTEPGTPLPTVTPGGSTVLIAWPTVTAGPSGILGYLIEYRTGASPTWFNVKTGAKTAAMSLQSLGVQSLSVAALTSNDVVTGNSFVAGGMPNGTILMRMSAVTGAGVASPPSAPIQLQLGPLPDEGISDASNYPNPFDSRESGTTFHYVLNQNADVSITIFSVFGRQIKEMSLAAGAEGGRLGSNNVGWDGTDDSGTKVSKGMYLAVIESGGAKEVLKVGVIH
ncbi:MAG: FlgD immunoglobulin-like domain containing protein, partial [Elusimicrobiota bacterium]